MKGFNFNSRCGESINKNINMEKIIANDDDDYLKKQFRKNLFLNKKKIKKNGKKILENFKN